MIDHKVNNNIHHYHMIILEISQENGLADIIEASLCLTLFINDYLQFMYHDKNWLTLVIL